MDNKAAVIGWSIFKFVAHVRRIKQNSQTLFKRLTLTLTTVKKEEEEAVLYNAL